MILEISEPQIGAALFHPSCLFLNTEATNELFKKPAKDGFPEFIHQLLTSDRFTVIDLLPAPESGWRLRVWKRDAAPLIKSSGIYVTTGFEAVPPLKDYIFKRPPNVTGNNTLLVQFKEATGVTGIHSETAETVQTVDSLGRPLQLTTKRFAGEGTSGPLLSQENLLYSDRSNMAWNYTIVREVLTSTLNAAGTNGALTLTSKTFENYDDFSISANGGERGMKRLISKTEAHNLAGQSPQTTTYQYLNAPSDPTLHGRLLSLVKPDGSWTYSEYNMSASSPVSTIIEYSGWKDLSMTQRASARKSVTTISNEESITENYVAAQLVSKTKNTTKMIGNSEQLTTAEKWDGSAWHVTTTAYHSDSVPAPATGRIKWIENSDGTATTYSYAIANQKLVVTARSGAGSRVGITAGTKTLTTYGLGNFPISEVTTDIASNLVTEQWDTDLTYNGGLDPLGRPIKRIYNADVNDYDITQYACCGLEYSRDRMGMTRQYFRDGLKRVYKMESKASAASPVVTDFTTITGLTQTGSRSIGGQSLFLGSTSRSLDGLTRTTTGPSQKSTAVADRPVTTTVTSHSATGDTEITTYADGSTAITASYLDGRTKSTTGTAVPDMSYNYATHSENGGGETTTITASGVITTQFSDLLARPSKTVSAATGTSISDYYLAAAAAGSRGKLKSMTDGDAVTTTYGYDAEGQRTTTARTIPLASSTATQVTTQDQDVVSDVILHGVSLGISRRSTQTVSSTGVAPVTVAESFVSRDGLTRGTRSLNGSTLSVTTRPDADGVATTTATQPDSTKSVQTRTHGLITAVQKLTTTGNIVTATTYGYDSLQRPITSTDARTGTTTMSGLTESGQPLTVITNSNADVTTMENDTMGRTIKTILPDSTIKYTAYHPTGQVKVTWGSQTYPTWNVYDEQGRQTQLHTWKVAPALTLASIPANPPAGSEATTWIFSPTTGHLARKQYADAKGTDYTYTPGGKIATRVWARGVTTTYTYTQGLLTLTDYSDATPDVAITYDPLGRQSTVTTVVAKSEFTYDPATLAVDTEVISYNLDATAGYEFFRVLDRSRDALGRDTGFILGSTPAPGVGGGAPASTIVEAQAAYAYSPTDGRIAQISNPQISNQTFSYAYTPNSNLLATVIGPIHTVINEWEPTRNVLDTKQNKVGTNVISSYDYAVNAIGQRTGVATSGTAYPALPSWLWGYDALGQVTSADSSIATSDRAYQYDAIGNRIEARDGVTTATDTPNYTVNALNQYTTIKQGGTGVSPVYDFDGNATAYPLPVSPTTNSTLLWDGENRLTEVKNSAGTIIEKNVFDSGSRKIATIANGITTFYLYDAWNCIAEYQGDTGVSPVLKKARLWGTDLSGSMQGAGGVGGILSESSLITSNSITFNSSYPTYDGNGNVSEYLDSTGQVTAHFEYDPFGNTVVNTDTSNQFAYRFSTKPLAFATGLYYYGYRYYDPLTGRWPSRDPIGERGGVNLYGFVGNDGVGRIDKLGLKFEKYSGPAKRDDKQFAADKGGETEGDWQGFKIEGPTESGKCWKLKLSGKLKVTIRLNTLPGSTDFVDNFGNNPYDHETRHELIHKLWSDLTVDAVNPIEGIYCKKKCAELAQKWGYNVINLHNARASSENANFDNLAYNAGREAEVAAWNQEAGKFSRRIDELKNELKSNNCSVDSSCK